MLYEKEKHMRWVQLSDLHFNFVDYKTNDNYDTDKLKSELIKALSNLDGIDFVTITGDCLYRFNESEESIKSLKSFSKKIANSCGIKKSQLYLVPGNHDVNRDDTKRSDAIKEILSKKDVDVTDKDLFKLGDYGYDRFKIIHREITGRNYNPNSIIERDNYNVINIDTCLTSFCNGEEGKLLCYLPKIEYRNNNDKKLNIVIMHHGFDCFKNSFSNRFQIWCEDNNVDIVLCGHSHIAGIRTLDAVSTNIKQFTCGAALVDDYAIPSFYVYDYDESSEKITVSLYTFFTKVGRWKLDASNIRTFNNGKYSFHVSRKGNYVFNDYKDNISIQKFLDKEQEIIVSLNKKFDDCYGNEFYSSKSTKIDPDTGTISNDSKPEKFNAVKAIYSIVKMNVPYTCALEIVNRAINTICSNEYKIASGDIVLSKDFRKVIYDTICEYTVESNRDESIDDINTVASRYARRYGHNTHMFIVKNGKKIELSYAFVSELLDNIILEMTDIKNYRLICSEKSSMEEFVMSFLQHLDLHEIDYYSIKEFIKIIITYPPHPWIVPIGDDNRIREYHKNEIKEHSAHLKGKITSLTVAETIYHSAALLVSYYTRIIGNTEKFPLITITTALNNIQKQQFENDNCDKNSIGIISDVYLIQFAKDLKALGFQDYIKMIRLVEDLKKLLNKNVKDFVDDDLDKIQKFTDFVNKISNYIETNRNKNINSHYILRSENKTNEISSFFSNILGVFTKGEIQKLRNGFWITPHLDKEFPLEKGKKQMLVVLLSDDNYEDFLKYSKNHNCNSKDKSIILLKPNLASFPLKEKDKIRQDLNSDHNVYYFDKYIINKINGSKNKREAFEKVLKGVKM